MTTAARKPLGRVDYPQYHLGAVFEAIVNAVAHRDYSLHAQRIRLFMFADRLEIHSPGALPNTLSLESMSRLSVPRNEILASLFSRYYPVDEVGLGKSYLMDRRGFGVEMLLRESEKLSGKLPKYESISDLRAIADPLCAIFATRINTLTPSNTAGSACHPACAFPPPPHAARDPEYKTDPPPSAQTAVSVPPARPSSQCLC